ncbi:MAG: GDSL-type esterase/lipase family protein, partial [Actinomycetota bacterium]|nr:GDSL-type esterase/lipase family protein [Actinomycetota bacterium]
MSVTVVALGDSFSCGEGVGLDIRPEQTWTALLCDALPGARLVNLSRAGARVRDVRRHQLPVAVTVRPELVTIVVGLNDVIRSGLSAEQLVLDMRHLVG